jgi:type I restriction enzyme S subunit
MSFPRYPSHKDSGVEWLGEVPGHWSVWKLAHAFEQIGSGTTPKTDNREYYDDGDIPWVNTGDLNDGELNDCEKRITPLALAQHSSLKTYPAGSLLIAMYGATIGKLAMLRFPATVNQACCVFAGKSEIVSKFMFYWFLGLRLQILSLATGGGQPNISQDILRTLRVACPDHNEQTQIAAFLDRETAKIDALVAEQRRLMELLKEKRQAVISHAVTQGLNPLAPMKPSGIEWLGDVPVHWEVKRLKYLGDAITGLTYSPADIVEDDTNGTLVLRSSNVQRGVITFDDNVYVSAAIPEELVTQIGDILICSRNGSRALIGKNATIDEASVGLTFGAFMTVFRSKHSAYLSCVLNSPLFEFQSGAFMTSTINQLTIGVLNNFEVPFPPADERADISAFLAVESAKLDTLTAEAQRAIDLLQERRTALISAAVTGQIDVRRLS